MPENEPTGTTKIRENTQLKAKVAEIEKTQIEILKAIGKIEEYTGEDFMEPGEYHGLSFE